MTHTTRAIPSDWDINDPTTWSLVTTVDAHRGYHHTGGVMREYQDIRHAAGDFESDDELLDQIAAYDTNDPSGTARWWSEVLIPIHRAEVAIAEASPEEIERAMLALGIDPDDTATHGGYPSLWDAQPVDDLEQHAALAERIIAALEEQS
jgi:hypothetical protein